MPRPSDYSPWRRLMLQAVLCVVLIATLGLASLVTRYKLHVADVKLAPPVRFGDMSVRLPTGWTVQLPRKQAGEPVVLKVQEQPAHGLSGRVVTIMRDHQEMPQPPLEYLLTSGVMPPDYAATLGGSGRLAVPAMTLVAGEAGYLVSGARPIRVNTGQVALKREIFATAMLPSRDVISVKLEGWGSEIGPDMSLVSQIAAGISLPATNATASDLVVLPDGCKVKRPAGFDQLPERDAHFTERHLMRSAPPDRWSAITLVPCVFFQDGDATEAFRTMLTARDGEWIEARITTKNGLLQADLPLRAGLPFPRQACLLTWPTGYALMVEMLAGSALDAEAWQSELKEIAGSVVPPTDGPTPVELLKTGEEEVARLTKIGLPSLLADVPRDQWWIWQLEGQAVGWNHMTFASAGNSYRGGLENRMMHGAAVASVQHEFETSADLRRHSDATVGRNLISGVSEPVEQFKEQTALADGKLSIAMMPDPSSGQVARLSHPSPPAFLPGPWLPLLTGKLTRREMILRTSQLPGLEAQLSSAALTIHIKPTTRPATFDVDLSGTGQVLTLSPDVLKFSASLQRRHANAKEVKQAFGGDRAMTP